MSRGSPRRSSNRPLDELEERAIFEDFAPPHRHRHAGLTEGGRRWPAALDELLVALCRPERLLDLARRFTLFDGPVKKVARYQQMFAVKSLLARIAERDTRGRRKGGVVWHTQGSGKSLTMVMLGKALALAAADRPDRARHRPHRPRRPDRETVQGDSAFRPNGLKPASISSS